MKKVLLFVSVLSIAFLLANSQPQFTAFSAASQNKDNAPDSAAQIQDPDAFALAQTIKRLTNRSTDGQVEEKLPDGGFQIDLQGGFQNVMLSKIDTKGEPIAACITSLDEANAFFGKNLETGEPVSSAAFQKDETTLLAARHGISAQEFDFYKKMIEDAAQRRADSPTSATINIINADGAGEGFNDATAKAPEGGNNGTTLGQQRLNLFNYAASIWGAYLDTTVPININSQFNSLTPCSTGGGVLGSAGTTTVTRDFQNAAFPGTWYPNALASKITGRDVNGATDEINARFNSDVDNGCLGGNSRFYYGLDNSTPSGRINLLVVLLHEIGHGLGFQSFSNGSTGALLNNMPDVYTRFMFDQTTNKYWYQMTDAERQASAINAGNVFWDGPNVKAASAYLTSGRDSAGRVQLFTPSSFQSGSSVSHWGTIASPNLLMEPNINNGLPLSMDLTREEMRDIGWFRDSNADLIPDTITNVLPSGNNLTIGSNVNITWTNTGEFNRNITIELSTDGGLTYPMTLASDITNTGSYGFTIPNIPTTQGRIRVREQNFVDPSGISAANFAISSTAVSSSHTRFDFDGDGRADLGVFRPSTGIWYLNQSSNGFGGMQFGISIDKIVPADFDGDGRTDVAVYRAGTWYIQRSQLGFTAIAFGAADDIPVPADFDGDGKAEVAVFRPSNGVWYIYNLTTNQFTAYQFGQMGDIPVVGDYDGDGRADQAVFRNGMWYLNESTAGFTGIQFGQSTDKPVPADFDGDGKTDIAVFRPNNGTWYLQRSQLGFTGIQFGQSTDKPVPADYDGDGKADIAVFRNGTWYLQQSTNGFAGIAFGTTNDSPLAGAFVP